MSKTPAEDTTKLRRPGTPTPELPVDGQASPQRRTPARPASRAFAEEAALPAIPGYEIAARIGEGGMGDVYLARQTRLNRRVAIKLLKGRYSDNAMYLARLEREALILAKISHPNVIACYDLGEHEGRKYVVMEYVEGETLGDLVARRGNLPQNQALFYLKQAVLGLDQANALGIIHRDVKPENLLLARTSVAGTTARVPRGQALKISDLGLAAFTSGEHEARLTEHGTLLGSPIYMSPEQTLGESSLDFRTDIFALGITTYFMVTGTAPFEGLNTTAVLTRKISESIPDPRSLRPELSPALSLMLHKMTARGKEDRYASYGELLRDIEAIEEGKPIAAPVLPSTRASLALLPETVQALGSSAPAPTPALGAVPQAATPMPAMASRGMSAPSPSPLPQGERVGVKGAARLLNRLVLILGLAAVVLSGAVGVLLALKSRSRGVSSREGPVAGKDEPAPAPPTASPAAKSASSGLVELKEQFLIEGNSLKGWTYNGDAKDFGFVEGALFLQNLEEWSWAQHTLPAAEYTLRAMVQVGRGADECEVQIGISGADYIALGVRLPATAEKLSAYLERRDARTNAVLDPWGKEDNLDEAEWQLLRAVVQDGSANCFVGSKPLGLVKFTPTGLQPNVLRIAVHKGQGRFQNLEVVPHGPQTNTDTHR